MERVGRAVAAHKRAERRVNATRDELHAAIAAALAAGDRGRQKRLVEMTGYTRERIRQLAKDAAAASPRRDL